MNCTKISCQASQLPSGYDTSSCNGLEARDFCLVSCLAGFTPASSKYDCGVDGIFSGTPPSCVRSTCPADLLPVLPGVNVSGCLGVFTNDSCNVTCSFGFQGTTSAYSCGLDSTFSGTPPVCERKSCSVPASYGSSEFTHSCNNLVHGDTCTVGCGEGYTGSFTSNLCNDGSLNGNLPSCTPIACTLAGWTIPTAIDITPCLGIASGQSCSVQCTRPSASGLQLHV